jgi:hypothetical protein
LCRGGAGGSLPAGPDAQADKNARNAQPKKNLRDNLSNIGLERRDAVKISPVPYSRKGVLLEKEHIFPLFFELYPLALF